PRVTGHDVSDRARGRGHRGDDDPAWRGGCTAAALRTVRRTRGTGTGATVRAVTGHLEGRIERQRITIVQRLLWVLLAIVVANLGLTIAQVGREILANPAFVPNMLAIPVIGLALWLNAKGNFRLAVLIVMGLTLGSATL